MSHDTNIYFVLRGPYVERKQLLAGESREWLEAVILDQDYNEFVGKRADLKQDPHGHGKRVPYIGWYWRHVPFHDLPSITIGNCGQFIGFMMNNKWDYDSRQLTRAEGLRVIAVIDEAMRISQQGGNMAEIVRETDAKIAELWPLMQEFRI